MKLEDKIIDFIKTECDYLTYYELEKENDMVDFFEENYLEYTEYKCEKG